MDIGEVGACGIMQMFPSEPVPDPSPLRVVCCLQGAASFVAD